MTKIKLLFIGLLMSFTVLSFSQVKTDTVSVVNVVDDMGGKSYLTTTQKLIVANEDKTKGFSLDVIFASELTLLSKMVGIGGCNENDQLIILLENGEKINMTSWKSFNCKGEGYFRLSKSTIEKLRLSPLSKIRITNGRSYDSYTGNVDNDDKNYFIQLFNSYYNGNYKTIKN